MVRALRHKPKAHFHFALQLDMPVWVIRPQLGHWCCQGAVKYHFSQLQPRVSWGRSLPGGPFPKEWQIMDGWPDSHCLSSSISLQTHCHWVVEVNLVCLWFKIKSSFKIYSYKVSWKATAWRLQAWSLLGDPLLKMCWFPHYKFYFPGWLLSLQSQKLFCL